MKRLRTRLHSNGSTAELRLHPGGEFYACYSVALDTPIRTMSYTPHVPSLLRAQSLADYFAHPGCDGVGCGEWQDAHGDDPACVEALRRAASSTATPAEGRLKRPPS